ncbi:MAG: DUF3800 domain-containing protein [Shimia thalassica]|uniref:DUF3800 domain-containing protein n=1 Tax=Shimia thalassica TaxID=1715693 RepID=UPI0032983EF0
MILIYCDESNLDAKSGDFLLYGGLTIDAQSYSKFSTEIWEIRKKHKIPTDFKAKYLPAPKGMKKNDYSQFKKDCIDACIANKCNFLVYQTLHDVAKDTDLARRNGINELCLNFSYILKNEEETGLILVDRFNDKGNRVDAHLAEKFSTGLTGLPHTTTYPLTNVVGLHYSAIGQSHMSSMIDIVLGTYRTAINIYSRKTGQEKLAEEILGKLHPLFRKGYAGGIPRISISFSPKSIFVDSYRASYRHVIDKLNNCDYKLDQSYDE